MNWDWNIYVASLMIWFSYLVIWLEICTYLDFLEISTDQVLPHVIGNTANYIEDNLDWVSARLSSFAIRFVCSTSWLKISMSVDWRKEAIVMVVFKLKMSIFHKKTLQVPWKHHFIFKYLVENISRTNA